MEPGHKLEPEILSLERQLQASHQELALLRHELNRLYTSRTWGLLRSLYQTLAWLALPGHLIGRQLTLTPSYHVTVKELSAGRAEWTFTGNDPQIELIWSKHWPLHPGHYELAIEVPEDADWNRSMRLYLDTGQGYSEPESVALSFVRKSRDCYAAMFDLRDFTEALRLDPAEREGTLIIGRAKIRLMQRHEFYLRAFSHIVRDFEATRWRLVRALRWAAHSFRQGGVRGLAGDIRDRFFGGRATYRNWIHRYDRLTEMDLVRLRTELQSIEGLPRIAVLMPVYNTPEKLLRAAIDSVIAQVHEDWELCIADDFSTAPHVPRVLEEYAARDKRIRWVRRQANGHISRASNSALELVTADWVALLDHDDVLRPHALAEVAMEIVRHPETELIYSDEDKLSESGVRFDPFFKPDFSRELFRSQNYLNHLTVHRTANIRAVGGWRPGFEGSQDYDLNLRICERIGFRNIRHIPKVLYHWRAVAGSTAAALSEKDYAYQAGFRALAEHVERMRLPATVDKVPGLPFYRLRFSVPEPQPLVSLIIPTRDRLDLLERAVGSIREKTTYRNYEIIIVDNGSTEPETLAYLGAIADGRQVRVLRYDAPFNFSAINNYAVAQARGDLVGLINNDVEVISPDWLTEMVSWAVQPEIGCVGAKLYYPNDTIQHGGVVLGIGGVANHAFLGEPRTSPSRMGRAAVLANWSAVTAACLIVRKTVYEEVGGLDETNLPVAFNDVDFCLRVGGLGLTHVWTPFAELYHHESPSRGTDDTPEKQSRFLREVDYMQRTWEQQLACDPFYSPNWSRSVPAFQFRI